MGKNYLKDLVESKPQFYLNHNKLSLKDWWQKEGWHIINDALIALYGCSSTWVCLENILDLPTDLYDYSQEKLIQLMVADGCDIEIKNLSGKDTICLNLA